ncbi:hypothetical protein JCM10207_004576 [Rhodosporidiobolus poonsookiae]
MVSFPSLLPRGRSHSTAVAPPVSSPSPRLAKFAKLSSGRDYDDADAPVDPSDLPYATSATAPATFVVPLTPPPLPPQLSFTPDPDAKGTPAFLQPPLDFASTRSGSAGGFSTRSGGTIRRQNEGEQKRLQGLMRSDTGSSRRTVGGSKLGRWDRVKGWMVNEGAGKIAFAVFVLVQALVFVFGFLNYALKDNLTTARRNFGITYSIARSAALVLHVDVAFILLPVCRSFISLLRRGPLNSIVPFEKNIDFHKAVAWSMAFFTVVHTIAHLFNAWWMGELASRSTAQRFVVFLEVNFTTGPGITGWIMLVCLAVIVWFAVEKRKKKHFERFWFSHHLFIPFFIAWQLHGMFCLIKPDRPPFCSAAQIGVFWKYWLVGGLIYITERILREVRSRHRTWVSKVVQHPSSVVEIQIKKEKLRNLRAGQYIFLNVPTISYFQWHPFTLTSAPEEDHISVHIRVVGDWTRAVAEALGWQLPAKGQGPSKEVGSEVVTPPVGRVLPRVMVDGPFGSASEDVCKYEVSILVGAGIGVTPFASILKHIWYRTTYPGGKRMALRKAYFFWVCRDYDSFEWLQSLLLALEAQDLDNNIEIHTYLTGRVKENDVQNIFANDVGGDVDALTGLRAPTHYGRPNWDRIFRTIASHHPNTDVGTFFCGPEPLSLTLHRMCNKHTTTTQGGTRFFYGKENF